MSMYNLIEYSNDYSKTSRSLWQFRNEPAIDDNGDIIDNSNLFKWEQQITGKLGNGGNK